MKTVKVLKTVSMISTSIGVGTIVSNIVKTATAAAEFNPLVKACVAVGTFAISGMISDQASAYMDKQIDSIVDTLKKSSDEKDESNGKS